AGSKDSQLTKPLAKRVLRDYVDRANNYQPAAARSRAIGKAATPFSVFAARWQQEVLVHKKASTASAMKSHVKTLLIPAFCWLAAETGLRAGELTVLRVGDVDFTDLYIEVSKAIWHGTEDGPKTTAGFRSVCISSRLGACLAEYLAGRAEGYLFQTGAGSPWDSSNVLERKLNTTLDLLGIPKIEEKLLAKIGG